MSTIFQNAFAPAMIILGVGVFLILVAIIGGGVEIKELKIPKIEKTGRILTGALGTLLMVAGFCVGGLAFILQPITANPTVTVPPTQISSGYNPASSINQADVPLPTKQGISTEVQQAAAKLIVEADKAEIAANYYQDDSYLMNYYAGDALQRMQQNIQTIKQSGYIEIDSLNLDQSYYTDMRMMANGSVLAIDECEYWKSYYYDPQTKALITETPQQLIPQTINIEFVGDNPKITSIAYYNNNAFCTR
jgi:hypothetical protein